MTDDEGAITSSLLFNTKFYALCKATGYKTERFVVEVTEENEFSETLVLKPVIVNLFVSVVDSENNPVAGAAVIVDRVDSLSYANSEGTIDFHGLYHFGSTASVSVTADGFDGVMDTSVEMDNPDGVTVTIALTEVASA